MIDALAKAVAQLPQHELRRAVILSMAGALIMVAACGMFAWLVLSQISIFGIGWIDEWITGFGTAFVVAGTILFYPATVMLVAGFFLDGVANAVERRYYPNLPAPRKQPFREIFGSALVLLMITVGMNLVLLPIYIVTLFVPGLNLLIFYLVNGYLLGWEFFVQVAGRRMEPMDAAALRHVRKWTVMLAGVIIALFTTIPVVNLAAPIMATAFMVHVFHRLRR